VISDHDAVRMLIGAYVLGGLSDADRHTLEVHLPDCDDCRAELAHARALTGLLRRAPGAISALAGPPKASTVGLLRQMRTTAARQKSRRRRLILAAASLLVIVSLGVGLLLATAQRHQSGGPTTAFRTVAGYTISGQVTLSSKPWGTSVRINVAHLPAQGPFVLHVSAANGRAEQACRWASTSTGRATVEGGTSLRLPSIRTITVVDHRGQILAVAHPT
jgi:predicted anti-sigma-YlaC factor YlaD